LAGLPRKRPGQPQLSLIGRKELLLTKEMYQRIRKWKRRDKSHFLNHQFSFLVFHFPREQVFELKTESRTSLREIIEH